MPIPISYAGFSINDNTLKANGTPESTSMQVAVTTMTPANAAATVTALGNLQAAMAAVTLGVFAKDEIVYQRNILGTGPAASNLAQRENKWLLRYHDATTLKKFTVSIGTADLSLLPAHSEFLDIVTAGPGANLKTAFEALVVSPDDSSHSVVLDSVQFVGRNR